MFGQSVHSAFVFLLKLIRFESLAVNSKKEERTV